MVTIETTTDGFDQLPDSLILLIFNGVSDVKTLIRCRSVSKRFNFLVPQTECLSLKVDQVISTESESDSILLNFFKSFLKSLHDLLTTSTMTKLYHPTRTRVPNSPAQILAQFDCVKHLQVELPGGDLKIEKGSTVKWRAEFGTSLKSCVIVGFKLESTTVSENPGDGADVDIAGGLKSRVMWTISALIAASARHFMLEEIVREHDEMETMVLLDRQGEGTVVMDKEGMRECRFEAAHVSEKRALVPSVRMRMRHVPRLMVDGEVWVEGATLVVVTPSIEKDDVDDAEVALGAFGEGIYREIVQRLLKTRSYMLEMNSL